MQSPLLGFNNNVKHRGRLFHIQTEDSGIRHPHVITHLFMDGGRILKTVKTSYAEHVGSDRLSEVVRSLMKEQHKTMFIALRGGQFDYVLDPDDAPPVSRVGGNSTSRDSFQPTPVLAPVQTGPGLAKGVEPDQHAAPEVPISAARSNQRRSAPEFFAAASQSDEAKINVVSAGAPSVAPTSKKEKKESNGDRTDRGDRPSSGRYAASRPAAIFASGRPPESGGSIFGDDMISEKSLDEVILSYLSEDLESTSPKK